ncbi:DUF559 domain-containing protein, partial [Candidatus Peregrinibacteria bacterium]|nr:DUF559 domain-containing protein [Candidatus Peregrinibacteria bacterium]
MTMLWYAEKSEGKKVCDGEGDSFVDEVSWNGGMKRLTPSSAISSIPQPLPPGEEGEHDDGLHPPAPSSGGGRGDDETDIEPLRKPPTPGNLLFFARILRRNQTDAEKVLWNTLRHDQFGVRFRRQYPLGGRILDFYCPDLNLAIEVDGSIHQNAEVQKEDSLREMQLNEAHG